MNKVVSWLKSIRLDRIITICMAGLLMLVSTACSGNASAKTPDLAPTADQIRQEVPSGAVTNRYEGGMNEYSDVDPRKDTSEAKAKAKGLIDNAQRNINEKSIDSPEQYVENYRTGAPLGERVKRIGENIGKAAGDVGEQASQGTRENLENAKAAGRDTAENTQQAVKDTAQSAKSKVDRDVENTKRAVSKAADAID
jgi:hypothetical protein